MLDSVTAGPYDLSIEQNATFRRRFFCYVLRPGFDAPNAVTTWVSTEPFFIAMVVSVDGQGIFQAVVDSTGVDPVTDDGTHWLRLADVRDLTGFEARAALKAKISDPSPLLELSSVTLTPDGSGITLGGAQGWVELLITDEDTSALPPLSSAKGAVWDLLIEDSADNAERLLKGGVTVDQGVTSVI